MSVQLKAEGMFGNVHGSQKLLVCSKLPKCEMSYFGECLVHFVSSVRKFVEKITPHTAEDEQALTYLFQKL